MCLKGDEQDDDDLGERTSDLEQRGLDSLMNRSISLDFKLQEPTAKARDESSSRRRSWRHHFPSCFES